MSSQPLSKNLHVNAEGVLERVPDLLLPYQQAWIADTSQVKICEKSRRIGISWAEAADDALHASKTSGSDVYYISYELTMTRQFIEDCAWWAKWYNLAASEIQESVFEDEDGKSIQVFRIDFASGHHIQALSSAPRNLRSKQGRLVIDEHGFIDPEKQKELLKAGLAFLIWGGDVRIISTHNGTENEFNQLVVNSRAGKLPYSVHKTTFAEAVQQGLYRRICLVTKRPWTPGAEKEWVDGVYAFYGDGAAEELDVIPARGGGKYFNRVLVEDCMSADVPVLRLALDDAFAQLAEHDRRRQTAEWLDANLRPLLRRLDPDLKSCLGADFGRTGDLSVFLPAQIQVNLVRRVAFALELRNVPHTTQAQIVSYIIDRLPRFTSGAFDAGGNGSYLAEQAAQKYGWSRIHQIKLSLPWYQEFFPKYKGDGIQERAVVLPADIDILDDHSDVVMVGGVPRVPDSGRRTGTADKGQRHGDAAIAAVLMWFASLQGGAPIESQSIPADGALAVLDSFVGAGYAAGEGDITEVGFGTLAGPPPLTGFF